MKRLSRFSYVTALVSIGIFVSWSVCTLVAETFGLKVFGNSAGRFLMEAIFPILAIVAGAVTVNLVSNIGLIAAHVTGSTEPTGEGRTGLWIKLFIAANLLLVALLFVGNRITESREKRQYLEEVRKLAVANRDLFGKLGECALDEANMKAAKSMLQYLEKSNDRIANPRLIFPCRYMGASVLCVTGESSFIEHESSEILDTLTGTFRTIRVIDTVNHILSTDETNRQAILRILRSKDDEPEILEKRRDFTVFTPLAIGKTRCVLAIDKPTQYGSGKY